MTTPRPHLHRIELEPGEQKRIQAPSNFAVTELGALTTDFERPLNIWLGYGHRVELDLMYLQHIWPKLYTLPARLYGPDLLFIGAQREKTLIIISGIISP